MGGCATKPKVLKADDAAAKPPEPLPDHNNPPEEPHKPHLPLLLHHDSSNKSHSLSSLFTQNDERLRETVRADSLGVGGVIKHYVKGERARLTIDERPKPNEDGKVIPESEKVETAIQEKPGAEEPSEDGKCHGTVTQEVAEKSSEAIEINEPIQEESREVTEEDKPSEGSQSKVTEVKKEESVDVVVVVEKPSGETESNGVIKGDTGESESESKNVTEAESADDVAVEKISGETETEISEVIKRESEEVREEKTESNETWKGGSEEVKVEKISRETETESKEVRKGECSEVLGEKISGESEGNEVTKGECSEERREEISEAEEGEGGRNENERVKEGSWGTEVEETIEKVIEVVEEATAAKAEEEAKSGQ